jgi:hypothetical protein
MKTLNLIILLVFSQIVAAQRPENSIHTDDHKNELGIANSAVYLFQEKEFAYGLHLHYVRGLKDTDFGIGIGYERIFDAHRHNALGVILSYTLLDHLNLSLTPGFTFSDDARNSDFGIHFETLYEFELGKFHIGPTTEFAYAGEDYHLSIGLHIGFGF